MAKISPTPEMVKDFWKYMRKMHGTKVIYKKSSAWMRTIGFFLRIIGVLDNKTFLTKYATTIGKKIYIPFRIGDLKSKWSLEAQISVCVHEHEHVWQYQHAHKKKRVSHFKFFWRYLKSPATRAHYEAHAYRTNMEMYFWNTGKMLNTAQLANGLKNYGCSSRDIRVAKRTLDIAARVIERGGVASHVSEGAIIWLEKKRAA